MKVSFWSYKGGTGRTLALANVGIELARRGRNVGLADFDLDAPGLYVLFKKDKEEINKRGHLADLLQNKLTGIISSLIIEISIPQILKSSKGKLYLLPSINTPFID
jgi:MinD-like ATPase involved in chromosome partitioning or flagellar assembly